MTTAETKTRASRQAATSARLTARSSSNAALSPTQAQQQPAYSLGQAPGVQLQRNLLQPQTAPPEELEQEESGQAEMPVQAKVVVGAPNDPYEQEADEVAEQVLRGQPAPSITPLTPGAQSPAAQAQREEREDADEHDNAPLEEPEELAQPLLQMQSDEESATATDETERPEELIQPWFVQRKCGCQGACNCGAANQGGEQERDGQVQTDAAPASRAPQPNTAAVSQALREQGGGAPLNAGVQQTLETHTGYDLSDVRVHQGQPAQLANRDLHARAFTHGNNIWLGSGESSDDLRLLAHEVTHVVQQNSASGDIQTLQRKPSDYQHPEDGGAVGGRLNQRFDEIDEDERPEEKPAVNRAELRQESSGLRGATKPDVNRPAQEQPRVEQSASVVEREAESPPDPLVKGEAASEPEGKGEGGEGKAMGAAEQAAALAAQSMAVANSQTEPGPETEVQPPEPVEPVDAAGEPLEADPEAEGALANLADRAQFLRAQGTLMRAQAAEGRSNAEITRANLAKVTGEIGQAEEGITKSQDHAAYRREVVGQAEQALGVSEEKQAKVAAESPEYTAKADEGKEETGPMSGEASSLAAENNANIPEDEDAAGDAREQGEQINQVGEQSVTMDSAVSQTRARAVSLGQDAARAAQLNTQTRGTISGSQQQLDQLDARLTEQSAQAAQARAQVESMAGQPEDLQARATQLDEQGQALIASSFELEARLHDTQQRYAAGTAAVPAIEEWDGEMPAEESGAEGGAEGAIQLTPDNTTPTISTPEVAPGGASTTTPTAATAATPAASLADTSAAGTAPAGPESASAAAVEPGAEPAAPTTLEAEDARTEEGAESAAEGEAEATAEGTPEAEDTPGAAEEAVPELVEDLEPREREPIDLTQALPAWVTGIEPESEARREEAAQEQEDQRRAEIAQINDWAGGRPISELGAGERVGIALRLVGGRYFNAVSNIKWPGWGGLARALLDPRSMLTGAVGGLNMILNAGADLFSAERWRQDPLGNLLQSSANIATGLAIILASITALAGLVAAVMGALILITFGFAAPVALPVIGVCTTIITTVGGWTIAVGKIALVLQALALIKNLIDAATAQTAGALQREAGQIQSNINGAATAAMSIVGARGAQAGIGGLRSRVAGVIRASRRAGGARALARATLRAAPGRLRAAGRRAIRTARVLPRRIGRGLRRRVTAAREAITSLLGRVRARARSLSDRLRGRGRPDRATVGPHRDTLRGTARKSGGELTRHEMDAELDVVRNTPPRRLAGGEYVEEVRLPNGHTWRRQPNGSWCRFSATPSICSTPPSGGAVAGTGSRPTPRQSEQAVEAANPTHRRQVSFKNGEEVPYGTAGSSRPDTYFAGPPPESIEVKNYNVSTPGSRAQLYETIQAQYRRRLGNLPRGTRQTFVIDLRGQTVDATMMNRIRRNILTVTSSSVAEVRFLL